MPSASSSPAAVDTRVCQIESARKIMRSDVTIARTP